jgi:nitrite reductase/ring-hydroxylating ferredoxin subunit
MRSMSKVRVASKAEIEAAGCRVYAVNGHTLALFNTADSIFALDNRCPHMGFPLDRGSIKDGILTCHWHHARFDLSTGGAFDLFADDVPVFPVTVEGDEIYVDLSQLRDPVAYNQKRLRDGLEQNISLVVAKAVINLVNPDRLETATTPFQIALNFGSQYRAGGWGMGQTINACMFNMLPYLNPADRPRAMYQGITAVSRDTAGMAPRFMIEPLPQAETDIATLKRWFRQFVLVRDAEGAERCVATAIQTGATPQQVADMFFAAVTDYRYLTIGHVADFTNKAFEALDKVGWDQAQPVLTSLITNYVNGTRMEERNSWRHPLDLTIILNEAFEKIPTALAEGAGKTDSPYTLANTIETLLSDDPQAIVELLLQALAQGTSQVELAQMVSYAAGRRIVHFHISNEFGDWDTVLHTFTYANAIQHAMLRAPSPELLRGVFDAAMSIYLDLFLNIPSTPLPKVEANHVPPSDLLSELLIMLNKQQQVNEAGTLVARHLGAGGQPEALIATLGTALLREDPDFHTIQAVETALAQYHLLRGRPEADHVLIAAARYLAAHAPTPRAQNQTYQIALRLHHGETLFEG